MKAFKRPLSKIDGYFVKKPAFVQLQEDVACLEGQTSTDNFALRKLYISEQMEDLFLTVSLSNTDVQIETCGILCGTVNNESLVVTHLVIPSQRDMRETCLMEVEEQVSTYCLQHNLSTLGWVHTHPTQSCFLSSVDVHTQCTYQLLLPESVAVVCSLKSSEVVTGYFSLTASGLNYIRSCKGTGFHSYTLTEPLFHKCTHVQLDPALPCTVVDLRQSKTMDFLEETPDKLKDELLIDGAASSLTITIDVEDVDNTTNKVLDKSDVEDVDNTTNKVLDKSDVEDVDNTTNKVLDKSVSTCACCSCDGPNQPLMYKYERTKKTCGKQTRKFDPSWYKKWPWLNFCEQRNAALCCYCLWMERGNRWTTSAKTRESAFSINGFSSWHVATSRFKVHEQSDAHRGASIAWERRVYPSTVTLLSEKNASDQQNRFSGLCSQMSSLRFLARQGLAFRGHGEKEGNLFQLMTLRAGDNESVKSWLRINKYMSHEIVNEQLSIMSLEVVRNLLIEARKSHCFSVIADETRDLSGTEQLSISIRWVDSTNCEVKEECIGRVSLEKMDGANVITDTLLRCNLDMNKLVGQGYDGGSNMAGHISGVAARISDKYPAACYVHCNSHCLQLCLQDAAAESSSVRDALNIITQLHSLITLSPKRLAVFENLQDLKTGQESTRSSLKPLCPTRWTVRSSAIASVLNNYDVIQDTLDVIIRDGKRDEVAAKASGIKSQMEKFSLLFGLYLAKVIFSASDQAATVLQGQDITANNVVGIIKSLQKYLWHLRESFGTFWNDVSKLAEEQQVNITVPRQRKFAYKLDDTRTQHVFETEDYYKQQFLGVIDVICSELTNRFSQPIMSRLSEMEKLLLDAASDHYQPVSAELQVYGNSGLIDLNKLELQLQMLPQVLRTVAELTPSSASRTYTSVRSLSQSLKDSQYGLSLLPEVCKLCDIYLTIPMTSATAERSFSSMRRLKTYLRQTMSQERLNACMILHIHKHRTDALCIESLARSFVQSVDKRSDYFGKTSQ